MYQCFYVVDTIRMDCCLPALSFVNSSLPSPASSIVREHETITVQEPTACLSLSLFVLRFTIVYLKTDKEESPLKLAHLLYESSLKPSHKGYMILNSSNCNQGLLNATTDLNHRDSSTAVFFHMHSVKRFSRFH